MVSRVNNSAFFADAKDPRYQTGNLWELPMQEDNPLMAHPGGMAQNGPMISNPLAAPPPQQQGGGFMPNAPQQAVPGQPPPQPGGMDAAMNSPYAQMAGTALQNLSNTSLGQYGSQVSPIQAYQQAVQQRAVLNQRNQALEQSAAAEKRAQEKFDIDKDPGYEYSKLVEQGLIDPEQTSFLDFQRMGLRDSSSSVQKNYGEWLKANPDATDEEKAAALDNIIRAPIRYDTGGGGVNVTSGVRPGQGGGGGGSTTLVSPETATANDAANKGAVTTADVSARGYEERDQAFLNLVDNGDLDLMEQSISNTEALLAEMESGRYDGTGPIEGVWNQFWGSPETAKLEFDAMATALENLQITNLAPVTENEIAMIKSLYANIGRDPEQNKAILGRALRMLKQKQALINKKGQYFAQNGGTLRGYGTNRWAPQTEEPQSAPAAAAKTYNPETGEIE